MFTQYSHVYVHEYILYNLKNSKLLFKAVIIEKKRIEVKKLLVTSFLNNSLYIVQHI